VVEGRENLSRITEEEKDYLLPEDLEGGMRLGCQVKIRKGNVTLNWKKVKTK
jgi:ferredoxin